MAFSLHCVRRKRGARISTRADITPTDAPPRTPMLISGFTVVRNAVLMGYPVVEAIASILPIVDEYIVAVGAGDDTTLPGEDQASLPVP